ncbi:MAG: flagellin lysine-N-methylase [Oscillibacter sp.]|nr:flagellin lysine-N-methylase [Oscillibacter sp.]
MKICTPDQYEQFHCLAGACRDTCCAGWEMPVDEKTAARYALLSGEWGEKLHDGVLTVDGERQMKRRKGRCIFLNEENLCELYTHLGAEALCQVCTQHPRFIEEYGAWREIVPSLSCPAWSDVYLMSDEPVRFTIKEDGAPVTTYNDIDGVWFYRLKKAREEAFALVQNREKPLGDRVEELLCFAEAMQEGIGEKEKSLPGKIWPVYRRKLQSLEILTPQWKRLLKEDAKRETNKLFPWQDMVGERVLMYYLFRFFMRAVYDGGILPWTKMAVWSWIAVRTLGRGCETREEFCEVIRLYSKEIEHSAKNVDALHRVLCRHSGRYGAAGLLAGMEEWA